MRRQLVFAVALLAACGEQPRPLPAGYTVPPPANPPVARPAPAASGTPAEQDVQRLQRALEWDQRRDRMDGVEGRTPRRTGEPDYAPFDEGAERQLPVMPDQASPAFRRAF